MSSSTHTSYLNSALNMTYENFLEPVNLSDVMIFTFYSDELVIDVETGIVTKYFFFRTKYCYDNVIIFKCF